MDEKAKFYFTEDDETYPVRVEINGEAIWILGEDYSMMVDGTNFANQEELETEIKVLREALAFYGDGKHWNQSLANAVMDEHEYYYYLLAEKQTAIERGAIARRALGMEE